ncbi:MAG TPA: NAD-dependent epimerase, partial [Nitrospira sp.]|nr:NAD-dependent epimerase [Nitrospira sp.]
DLQSAVRDLRDGLMSMDFCDPDFRKGELIRLVTLRRLRENDHLTDQLAWKDPVAR